MGQGKAEGRLKSALTRSGETHGPDGDPGGEIPHLNRCGRQELPAAAASLPIYRAEAAVRLAEGQKRGADATAKRLPRIDTREPPDRGVKAVKQAAEAFGVGEATVQRTLRQEGIGIVNDGVLLRLDAQEKIAELLAQPGAVQGHGCLTPR